MARGLTVAGAAALAAASYVVDVPLRRGIAARMARAIAEVRGGSLLNAGSGTPTTATSKCRRADPAFDEHDRRFWSFSRSPRRLRKTKSRLLGAATLADRLALGLVGFAVAPEAVEHSTAFEEYFGGQRRIDQGFSHAALLLDRQPAVKERLLEVGPRLRDSQSVSYGAAAISTRSPDAAALGARGRPGRRKSSRPRVHSGPDIPPPSPRRSCASPGSSP